MNITTKMAKDLDKIAPGVEALAMAYRAGYRRRTIEYCTPSLIGTAIGMVITGIMVVAISKSASTEETEEPES